MELDLIKHEIENNQEYIELKNLMIGFQKNINKKGKKTISQTSYKSK